MKIGITLDFAVSFWANGLQQNVIFLYQLLSRVKSNDCYYIFDKEPPHTLGDEHKGMSIWDVMDDETEKLDVLLVAGFDLHEEMYEELLKRNDQLKIIVIHYGNKLLNDMHYSVGPESKKKPISPPKYVSQVWVSPHYEFGVPYFKTYYRTKEVHVCPYIWDKWFVQAEISALMKKGIDPTFKSANLDRVCIFEPNITVAKNCIIPVAILQEFIDLFPNDLKSGSIFCCDHIRKKPFFMQLMNKFPIVKREDFIYFNNRHGMLDAVSKYGNIVLSHQIRNDLNYIYFEALYLGLPLVHNSDTISECGYYYPDCDVEMGARQIKNAMLNHESQLDSYKGDAQRLFQKHSPYSESNIAGYMSLIDAAPPGKEVR